MNFRKLFLGLFACMALFYSPCGRAVEPVGGVVKKTWEQWWSARAISYTTTINPYAVYKVVVNHPIVAMVGTGVSVALGIGLYLKYHWHYDWVAKKYKEICDGARDDLTDKKPDGPANKTRVLLVLKELNDAKLSVLVNDFYKYLNPTKNTNAAAKFVDIETYCFGGYGNYSL